jgi:hypothetical protein
MREYGKNGDIYHQQAVDVHDMIFKDKKEGNFCMISYLSRICKEYLRSLKSVAR